MQKAEAVICLSALAHEQRLAIFRLLVSEGPSGLLAGEIAEAVGATAEASANNRTISVQSFPCELHFRAKRYLSSAAMPSTSAASRSRPRMSMPHIMPPMPLPIITPPPRC